MTDTNKQRTQYVIVDWVTTTVAFLLFNVYRYYHLTSGFHYFDGAMAYIVSSKLLAEEIVFPLVMLFIYWLSGYYYNPFQRSRLQELWQTFFSALINTLLIYLALLTNDQIQVSSRNYATLSVLFVILFGCTYVGRIVVTGNRLKMIRQQKWKFNTLIIGTKSMAHELTSQLNSSLANLGYAPEAYILTDDTLSPTFNGKPTGKISDVRNICRDKNIRQIIIAMPKITDEQMLEMLRDLFVLDIPIKITPTLQDFLTSAITLNDINGEPFIDISGSGVTPGSQNVKRTFDVIVSSLALIFLALPALIIAVCIKRDSKGPVLYRQSRIGRHRRPFNIYKFRTMRTDAEANGPQLSSDTDARVTKVGRYLRKYRIDEVPQFWNVLKGDMSLVGPRPEREHYITQIVKRAPYYTLLHRIRPGITSWGMVKYGYASDIDQMIERSRFDLLYISNMSIMIDLKILIYTIRTVLMGKGK